MEAKKQEAAPYPGTMQLVSPKRLIFEDEHKEPETERLASLIEEYRKVSYAIDTTIKVKKIDEDYLVLNHFDEAKAALYAEVNYVPITI